MNNNHSKPNKSPSSLTNFLWTCAGVNKEVLLTCPKTEWIKYAGVGATVLFTGILASVSGGYALYTVFRSFFIALPFALLWGTMIFNLDRYIVSTIKKEGNFNKELKQVVPRIILSIFLGIVISKPLELKIFEKEINQTLTEERGQKSIECMVGFRV